MKPSKKAIAAYPEVSETIRLEQTRAAEYLDKKKALETARLTTALLHIAEAVLVLYQDSKRERAALDYQDLIEHARKLLLTPGISPWVMFKLDAGIDHILIDEAQDTSPDQWEIIQSLAEEIFAGQGARTVTRTLFVVGDEKQSIFSFQGADPRAFSRMRQYFQKKTDAAELSFLPVTLEISYRSSEPVLRAVDIIFKDNQLQQAVSSSDSSIHHKLSRKEQAGRVELWPLFTKADEEAVEPWPLPITRRRKEDAKAQLADAIAKRIAHWLETGRKLESRGRPIEPRDIMILVQQRGPLVEALGQALRAYHVPVAGNDRIALKNHIAIMDLLALGEFVLLPPDDLTLACVLKSPLIGLSENQLFDLAYGRESTLWNQLAEKRAHHPDFERAWNTLSRWIEHASYASPFEFYSTILEAEGERRRFLNRLGTEANDLLNAFLDATLTYEQTFAPTLQGFVSWFKHNNLEAKQEQSNLANEVRIMTIHAAKGLQSPIVILPDIARTPPSNQDPIIWESAPDGLFFFKNAANKRDSFTDRLVKNTEDARLAEYYRLLYVALTRAEDELYLCGYSNRTVAEHCWYRFCERALAEIAAKEPFEALEDSKMLVLSSAQTAEARAPMKAKTLYTETPPHISSFAPMEPPLVKRLDLFSGMVADSTVQDRGALLCRLLDHLSHGSSSEWPARALKYLEEYTTNSKDSDTLIHQAIGILSHPIFGKAFVPEALINVTIAGAEGNTCILAEFDRLLIGGQAIIAIRYNRHHLPSEDKRELLPFQRLLTSAYPDKIVHFSVLWAAAPHFTEISSP